MKSKAAAKLVLKLPEVRLDKLWESLGVRIEASVT